MSEAPKITMPEPPSLPISSFFMVPVAVPKKAITGFDGEETRAVSIADARRYALAAYLAGMEAAAQIAEQQRDLREEARAILSASNALRDGDGEETLRRLRHESDVRLHNSALDRCAAAIRRAAEGAIKP